MLFEVELYIFKFGKRFRFLNKKEESQYDNYSFPYILKLKF